MAKTQIVTGQASNGPIPEPPASLLKLCPRYPEMCSTADCLACYLAHLQSRIEALERWAGSHGHNR